VQRKSGNRVIDKFGIEYNAHQAEINNYPGWKVIYLHNLRSALKRISDPLFKTVGLIILVLCLLTGLAVFFLYREASHDIVLRKRAEEALRESEERFRNVYKTAPLAFVVWDKNTRVTDWNKSAEEIFSWSKEEVVGHNFFDFLIPEKDRPQVEDVVNSLLKGDILSHSINENLTKEGKIITCEWNNSALHDDDGNIIGAISLGLGITDRKQAEEAVRESESKFRSLFELSPQAVALTELKSGRLVDVNNKFCELTKYSKEEILGLNTTELGFYLEADRIKFLNELQASGAVNGLEMDFKAKDNSILHTLMFARIIQLIGESFILTIFHNVTEQKRLQAQLQQAQKMESLGTLAGGIAHDFNNLLMGIQGRTSLMLMDSDSSHPYFEHLKGIGDYVKSAADLTRQMLGFARGGKYEIKPTDLNELIINENRMFGRTRKEINIQEKFEENLWTVEGDRGQIEQVLLNIYVNAWQAMPGGGDLYIQSENIIIDEYYVKPYHVEPGRYVKISITDTGVGMDEATQQRIFDPFFTTKEMERGTGLGLASAYGIIKNHDGFINVYSKKGEGTTFNIYFPASEKEAVKEKEIDEEWIRGTETVLLVDDEDMIIDIGQDILKTLGYKVLLAKSGEEALLVYKENRDKIDMIILDMIMPGMGGGETYDILKEINPDIMVLLSSGYSINGQASEILDRGCNGFIQKPFNIADLSKKIREVLGKK
jgi:PAS domain S-box-containing protein